MASAAANAMRGEDKNDGQFMFLERNKKEMNKKEKSSRGNVREYSSRDDCDSGSGSGGGGDCGVYGFNSEKNKIIKMNAIKLNAGNE